MFCLIFFRFAKFVRSFRWGEEFREGFYYMTWFYCCNKQLRIEFSWWKLISSSNQELGLSCSTSNLRNWRRGTTRSGACRLTWLNTAYFTRPGHWKVWVGSVACYKTAQWSLASLPCSTHRSEWCRCPSDALCSLWPEFSGAVPSWLS